MGKSYKLSNIPLYPQKEPISLKHKELIDKLNAKEKISHSSTNFTNLFILDTNDTFLSKLDDILLIQQLELFSNRTIYLALSSKGDDVSSKLESIGIGNLVMYPYQFKDAQLDEDNSDYIYNVRDLVSLKGNIYASIRRKVHAFEKYGDISLKKLFAADYEKLWHLGEAIYKQGVQKTPSQKQAVEVEKQALEKTLNFSQILNVNVDGLFINQALVAFAITEVVNNNAFAYTNKPYSSKTLLIHFFRVDTSYKGISEYLFHKLAKQYEENVEFINFEQDLGIQGLRKFKQYLKPCCKVKVYSK